MKFLFPRTNMTEVLYSVPGAGLYRYHSTSDRSDQIDHDLHNLDSNLPL